jgi:type III secretory pathway component EscU
LYSAITLVANKQGYVMKATEILQAAGCFIALLAWGYGLALMIKAGKLLDLAIELLQRM